MSPADLGRVAGNSYMSGSDHRTGQNEKLGRQVQGARNR